ncbi:MAG: hypothetical protein PHD48_01005 [Alphaproteobacteria bacterium]|nr:hypothetical protein [Alphaproteobacteria bacterium]
MTTPKSLTDTALSRLRALTTGNDVAPDLIHFIDSDEQTYTVCGKLTLTPHLSVKSRMVLGRVKGKDRKILSSFEELNTEIKTLEKEFKSDATWLDTALEELEKESGHGWGHTDALLTWSKKTTLLAATENCPTCRGSAQRTCPECKGLGTLHCHYCEGRGHELCILCAGSGKDPHDQQKQCPTCQGTRYSLCRFCQGTGKLPCPTCNHQGTILCADCKGTGCISREAMIKQAADMQFTLHSTADLPSGLLRTISRIGDEKLHKGHADITMRPLSDEEKKDKAVIDITLEAQIPYADIKVRFGKRAILVSCFGKRAVLSGVPPFLDDALKTPREHLAQTAKGTLPLEGALQTRLLREALDLSLSGKNSPNSLRRLYPIGLSANVAAEIMNNLRLALKVATSRTRLISAALTVLFSTLLFSGLFFTPTFMTVTQGLTAIPLMAAIIVIPLLVIAASWLVLLHSTKWGLHRRFPTATVALSQSIGKTGYSALALIAALYLVILYFSGHLV